MIVGTAMIVAGCSSARSAPPPTPTKPAALGPEGVPIPQGPPLAQVDLARYGKEIDGIQCETQEQVAYHIHAHLAIFVSGAVRQVPFGIGIAPPQQVSHTATGSFVSGGSCFYWLHTHASDGVIHVESPNEQTYTLGQFFDMWGQPLTTGQVGPATGALTVTVDGQPFIGDPRSIILTARRDIAISVGTPVVAPPAVNWSLAGL